MLSLRSIHPDWLGRPGASLGSEAVRALLLGNPRIVKKLQQRVARAHDLSADDEVPPEEERVAFDMLVTDMPTFATRLGLALYGNYLAGSIDRAHVQRLAGQFPLDDLRRAVRLRGLSPLGKATNFDDSRFSEIVESTGEQCLMAWAAGLPAGCRQMAMLVFSKSAVRECDALRQRFPAAADMVRALASDVAAPGGE